MSLVSNWNLSPTQTIGDPKPKLQLSKKQEARSITDVTW